MKNKSRYKNKPKKSKQIEITVKEPMELMDFIMKMYEGKNRNKVKSLLKHGQVVVDDLIQMKYNYKLNPGQKIIINGKGISKEKMNGVKIMFEDNYVIVIEKESGLLTIATNKEKLNTANSILREHVKEADPTNKLFIVHRLDRDTSGVMIFARNKMVKETFQNEWNERILERAYVAILEGNIPNDEGTIESYLKENRAFLMYSTKDTKDGKKAITRYKVLKRVNNYTLVEIHLDTGRKNQIRVHMQNMGHSIIGDKKYEAKTNPIGRLGLHAKIIEFKHPITNKIMRYESPLPKEFKKLMKM
ncbi:RluA family pseudouridine synthase [Haliovirga abyssi]|uniref:Pseudouridine synthase n=1 Tax=Haliovirga abyssi TaxID=2996794 RepID=A0AAU9DVZ4_9FUSO|nr:RluA family pseudouridine synthase [Haliovirga abyssi]BDU51564.1 pseudouridine synthase [Haliovirga abyssi]